MGSVELEDMTMYDLPEGAAFLVSQKALLRNPEGKYLLMKSIQMTADDFVHWGLPGGLLENGESLEAGLIREVGEETGLNIRIGPPVANCTHRMKFTFKNGKTVDATIVNLIYKCETDSNVVQLSDEHTEYKWMTEKEICGIDPVRSVNLEKIISYFKELGF